MAREIKNFESKIQEIDKYYNNDTLFLRIYFEDYNTFHIYIRLDYEMSTKSYKLRWFDLERVRSSKIKCYESSEYLECSTVEYIKSVIAGIEVSSKIGVGPDSNVSLFVDSKCKNSDSLDIKFYRSIPNGMKDLAKIFEVIFLSLPKKINVFYEEISGMNGLEYQYSKTFRFNLLQDDLSLLYDVASLEEGEKCYKENEILFLEKQENKYVGVVKDKEHLCVVVIKYDDKSHDMRVQCSCSTGDFCRHIYAVIKAIRNDDFISFYKVMPKKEAKGMCCQKGLDIKSMLSVGIVENEVGIINDNGEIIYCEVVDENGKLLWNIVEDDMDNGLMEKMASLKNN